MMNNCIFSENIISENIRIPIIDSLYCVVYVLRAYNNAKIKISSKNKSVSKKYHNFLVLLKINHYTLMHPTCKTLYFRRECNDYIIVLTVLCF